MEETTVKIPIKLLMLIVFLVCIVVIVAAALSGGNRAVLPAGVKTCTVQAEVGVESVKISNQNIGTSIIITATLLPYSFNFTSGDTLQFNVSTMPGYTFNAWVFNTGTFDNHNPLNLKPKTRTGMP